MRRLCLRKLQDIDYDPGEREHIFDEEKEDDEQEEPKGCKAVNELINTALTIVATIGTIIGRNY